MTLNHLFSPSLFYELFQHDIVACDGHILASDEGFQKYREFLMDRSSMRTAQIFQKRKGIVDNLQSLMKASIQPTREMKILLKKLGLCMTEKSTVTLGKVVESQQDLGPSHIKRSLSERRVAAHKAGLKTQTRDLKHLDEWLARISGPKVRVKRAPERTKIEWKYEEFKYRAKLESVLKEMAKGRRTFVKKSCSDVQYKWISAMERILENIAESKKIFGAPLKGHKKAENDLNPVKGCKGAEKVVARLKGDKEAEDVLALLKADKQVENVLPPLKGDEQVEDVLAPLKSDKEAKNVLIPPGTESKSADWPSATEKNSNEKEIHKERVHRHVGIHGVETVDIIAESRQEEIRTEETNAVSPVDEEDDTVRCISETGSKTKNPIPVAEPDDRIVGFGREGKRTEESNADSLIDEEHENVRSVTESGSKTENWKHVAGPEDRIAEFEQEGNRIEENSVDSPVGDEDDNSQRVLEIGSETENSTAVAGPDGATADFERDGKCTEEKNAESPVDDEDENILRVPGTECNTDSRILVSELEDKTAVCGPKGYWSEKTNSVSAVEDEDHNLLPIPETGNKSENSIAVARPKEITDAESEETVTLDLRRRIAHYRKATPEEDSGTKGSSDTRNDP